MPDANGRLDPPEDVELAVDDDIDDDDPETELDDAVAAPGNQLEIAFTPRQILGGFALLAALILLLRRRRRTGSSGEG